MNEHFIRPGRLAPEHGRALSRVAGDRNDADYDVTAVLSGDVAEEDIARARAFVDAVSALVGGLARLPHARAG